MNGQTNERHGHGAMLMLPVLAFLAVGVAKRHAWAHGSWAADEGRTQPNGGGHLGRRGGFFAAESAEPAGGPHLPPRIERALDAWHSRAHEASPASGGSEPESRATDA